MATVTSNAFEDEMKAAGFEPAAPYPGKTGLPWPSRCLECGQLRRPTLHHVRGGYRCKHRGSFKHVHAVQEMRAAGYEPLSRYPGRTDSPWPSKCATCGKVCSTRLSDVRRGKLCKHVSDPQQAEEEMRAAGYEPEEPYPGKVNTQWTVRCVECGQLRHPSLTHIRRGIRCKHLPTE
jgi:hypothetical protein